MDILIAFLVMFGIAVLVGILLLLCSHFFAVKENPLKRQVRECLPGINCGACGYKGCDDYASAIAEDGAKPKPHERITARVLADAGYIVRFVPSNVLDSFRMKNIQDRSVQNFLLGRLKLGHGLQRIIFVNRKREVVDINSLLR